MKFLEKNPSRKFQAGKVEISDCASIELNTDEQVTFKMDDSEYDVVQKEWGFYATPSTNARLIQFGLKTAIVKSTQNKCFVLLVKSGKEASFERYLKQESMSVLAWIDSDAAVESLESLVGGKK